MKDYPCFQLQNAPLPTTIRILYGEQRGLK
jgi:hypothetical protein